MSKVGLHIQARVAAKNILLSNEEQQKYHHNQLLLEDTVIWRVMLFQYRWYMEVFTQGNCYFPGVYRQELLSCGNFLCSLVQIRWRGENLLLKDVALMVSYSAVGSCMSA